MIGGSCAAANSEELQTQPRLGKPEPSLAFLSVSTISFSPPQTLPLTVVFEEQPNARALPSERAELSSRSPSSSLRTFTLPLRSLGWVPTGLSAAQCSRRVLLLQPRPSSALHDGHSERSLMTHRYLGGSLSLTPAHAHTHRVTLLSIMEGGLGRGDTLAAVDSR